MHKPMPSQLSFSGLLNAVDGIAATEGRVLFMTTNHLDRLDPALVRPGRVDMVQHLGLCSREQLRALWRNFYPAAQELAEQFAQQLPENQLSPAVVQGWFLFNKHTPRTALDGAQRALLGR